METIGERVKRLREKRGWTQAQLTARMGANSTTTLSRIENGVTKEMRIPMAQKLAEIFDVTPEYIMYGENINNLYTEEVYRFIMNPKNVELIDIFVKEQILKELKRKLQKEKGGQLSPLFCCNEITYNCIIQLHDIHISFF